VIWFWCSDIYIFQSSVTIFNGSITSMLLCLQTIVLWFIDIMNTCLRLCFHWSLICMSITCKALHKRVRVMVFNATFKKYFSYIKAVKVYQWCATGRWFPPGTTVFYTYKADRLNITEIFFESGVKHHNPNPFM
jgi:hypothetical protein